MPAGYKVVPYYDRTKLVDTTLHTVLENLTIGMALVFVVLLFFLGNLRAAIIAAINIPLALCGAFTLMYFSNTPANLISLGAIDFGIIIDTTVIVVENIHRHISDGQPAPPARGLRLSILHAAQEVGAPMFFSTLVFLIAFLPLFTMRGVEGAIFSPMSHTYAYALGTAIVLAITLSPVLASYLFRRGLTESGNSAMEFNQPLLSRIIRASAAMAAADAGAYRHIGGCCVELVSATRRPIPAQAGGGEYLGARDDAADHLAGS